MDQYNENYIIDEIEKKFLSHKSLDKLEAFISSLCSPISIQLQKSIMANTVYHYMNKHWPIPTSYQKSFLKCFINTLENQKGEILDEIYEEYCNLISKSDEPSEMHYRHFVLKFGKYKTFIPMQESKFFVSKHTTGLYTWKANEIFAQWCMNNKSILEEKVILELGCGVGYLGIAIIKTCSPKEYIFTDGSEAVLSILRTNIERNKHFSHPPQIENYLSHCNTNIKVEHLLWENIEKWVSRTNIKPDIILASDITFDTRDFPSLVQGLEKIIRTFKSIGFIATQVRNEATLSDFLKHLDRRDVSYQDQTVLNEKSLHPIDTRIQIMKIF